MPSKTKGRIIVPRGAIPLPHELAVATILTKTGNNVEFLPVKTIRTADIIFCDAEWEIKSPLGTSRHTIENNLRSARQQSKDIIIDLSRIKGSELRSLRELKRQLRMMAEIKNLLVITKNKNLISLKGLDLSQ